MYICVYILPHLNKNATSRHVHKWKTLIHDCWFGFVCWWMGWLLLFCLFTLFFCFLFCLLYQWYYIHRANCVYVCMWARFSKTNLFYANASTRIIANAYIHFYNSSYIFSVIIIFYPLITDRILFPWADYKRMHIRIDFKARRDPKMWLISWFSLIVTYFEHYKRKFCTSIAKMEHTLLTRKQKINAC